MSSSTHERRGPASIRSALKPFKQTLDHEPFLPADVVALARWTAEYYAAGPGETILAVLPPKTRGDRADAHKTLRMAAITAAGLDAIEARGPERTAPAAVALTAKQREALEMLSGTPTGLADPRPRRARHLVRHARAAREARARVVSP